MEKHSNLIEYYPTNNGKAERLNKNLVEKAKCMLKKSDLNKNLCCAATIGASYLKKLVDNMCLK